MDMASLGGRRAGTRGLGGLLLPLLFLGAADSQLVLSVGPSPVRVALGSDVQLPCTFTVRERFEISKFYLVWSREGHTVAEYAKGQQIYRQESELFPEELSRGNCSLLLSQVTVQDGGRYTSTVIYTPDKEEKQLELQVMAAPRVSLPRRSAVMDTANSFPCHVWGFYPGDIDIAWLRDGQVLTDATQSAPQRNPDGTFNLTLTYTFTPTARDPGSIFSCHVSHSALAQPLQEEFPLVMGVAPRISVPRRTVIRNTDTYIPCLVWGFYPEDVTVTWLRNRRVLSDTIHSAPQRNPDGTFNITAIYIFTPTDSDSDSNFSCHVSHSALVQPLEEVFTLDVTGSGTTVSMVITGVCVALLLITVAALAIYCWRHRRALKGRGAPYSVSKVLGLPERCLLGQEVTLSCSMGGTFHKDMAVMWEWIHGEDRTVIATDGGSETREGPEEQPLLHPRPQGWRATQERSGTCLMASLTFTPRVQDEGARVRCTFHHEARGIREQRESGEIRPWGAYKGVGETPPEDSAGSRDKMHGEDRAVMGHDGIKEAMEGHENQPLLPPQFRDESMTQEPEDRAQVTAPGDGSEGESESRRVKTWGRLDSAGSNVCESQEAGEAIAAAPGTWAPGPNGDSSANTKEGLPRPGTAGDGAEDKASAGLAGNQGGGATSNFTAVGTREPAAEMMLDTAQEEDTPGETGGNDSAGSKVDESLEGGEAVTDSPSTGSPGPNGDSSANTEAGLPGPATARDCAGDKASAGLAGKQGEGAAPNFTLVETREPAAETVQDTLQEEEALRETGGNGLLQPPEVSEIFIPKSVTEGEETTLTCRMTGHFPGVLSVAWLKRGSGAGAAVRLFHSPEYSIDHGAPQAQDRKSFQQETRLSFTPSVQQDHGAEYICRVGHVALKAHIVRHSRELHVAGRSQPCVWTGPAGENQPQRSHSQLPSTENSAFRQELAKHNHRTQAVKNPL